MSPLFAGMKKRQRREWIVILILFLLSAALVYLNLSSGQVRYTLNQIWQALNEEGQRSAIFTIRSLRFPRTMAGLLAGFAFGLAGCTLQKLLRNPLASPDVIGVSAGSSAAAVFAMLMLHISGWPVTILAITAGISVTLLIYWLAHGQGYNDARLILIGIGFQAFLMALISWMLQLASEYEVASAMRWISGSLNDIRLERIPFLAVTVLVLGIALVGMSRHLQILELGQEYSQTLGARPDWSRLILVVLAVCLTSVSVAVTGPIAGVAFLAGPIARSLCRTGNVPLLAAGFTGSTLVLAADWIAQNLLPVRYPVGILTGILGASYLLLLLLKMNKKG